MVSGFWQLLSLIVCSAGFAAVLAAALLRGNSFAEAVFRATVTFTVLFVVQSLLGTVLSAVAHSGGQSQAQPVEDAEARQS